MLRPPRGLCLLLLVLASANIARSTVVGDDWQFIFNVAIGILALAIGITSGQSLSELGLDTSSLKRGLNHGAVPFAIISAIMIVLGLVGVLNDDRTDVSLLQMLLRVLVVIPIGTVLVEEIAFRGTLDALLRKSFGDGIRSLVLGAVIFGAWHVFPT
ncbi:MAG TPA: CPBP family glutamic-type intramembrane protease, partial [Microthrixaceae bacterium]|nr:CPBP family glutamic-type intramembrane protease [Microthrixaceae bacterium]